MTPSALRFLFLNIGHFLDHFFMLIFATVAALQLSEQWQMSYAELIPYATPGFIAFAGCAYLSGWLADKWDREAMMALFFIGIGASAVLISFVTAPWQLALGLTLMGMFAAIYHPVGISLVVQGREKPGMALAINGVYGNLGVAVAALAAALLIDLWDWRSAFWLPGAVSILVGLLYSYLIRRYPDAPVKARSQSQKSPCAADGRSRIILMVIATTTAVGALIFQSITFALPEIFQQQLPADMTSTQQIGWLGFMVFSIAACAQLVMGFLLDRYAVKYLLLAVAGLQAILFALLVPLQSGWVVVLMTLTMFAAFSQIPITDVLIARIADVRWKSRAYALNYTLSFSVMASTVPLISWTQSVAGFSLLFTLLAAAATCLGLIVLCWSQPVSSLQTKAAS